MRPTWADIDLSAIKHNVMELKKLVAPSRFCAVVKADAYGHGAVPVARAAVEPTLAWHRFNSNDCDDHGAYLYRLYRYGRCH